MTAAFSRRVSLLLFKDSLMNNSVMTVLYGNDLSNKNHPCTATNFQEVSAVCCKGNRQCHKTDVLMHSYQRLSFFLTTNFFLITNLIADFVNFIRENVLLNFSDAKKA